MFDGLLTTPLGSYCRGPVADQAGADELLLSGVRDIDDLPVGRGDAVRIDRAC